MLGFKYLWISWGLLIHEILLNIKFYIHYTNVIRLYHENINLQNHLSFPNHENLNPQNLTTLMVSITHHMSILVE